MRKIKDNIIPDGYVNYRDWIYLKMKNGFEYLARGITREGIKVFTQIAIRTDEDSFDTNIIYDWAEHCEIDDIAEVREATVREILDQEERLSI